MIGYRQFRRTLFWTFVLGFFLTAGVVLFFAFGYRYSFERGIFVYSGSITMQTTPEVVSIRVDGEDIPEQKLGILNNSILISGLMPGEHYVEVSAPGYATWGKHAIVGSGVSTEFWNVVLTREDYAQTPLLDTARTIRAFPEPGGTLLALVKKNSESTSVVVWDRATGTGKEVFSSESLALHPEHYENIEWSADGKEIILPLFRSDNTVAPVIVDIETGKSTLLSDLHVARTFSSVRFEGEQKDAILFIADGNLYRTTLGGAPKTEFLLNGVRAYDISGNFIYVARGPGESIYRFRSGTITEDLSQVTLAPTPSLGESPVSLVVYDEDRLALLERSGTRRLFVYNLSRNKNYGFQELGSNVSGLQFSDDGKKLLFYSRNEIHVYFTRPWEVQPERAENATVQIGRFSDVISGVQWTEDYEHVLYAQGATVKMIELDPRDRRVIENITTLPSTPTEILSLFGDNLLLFVLPESDLLSIVFPEPQTLFGQ